MADCLTFPATFEEFTEQYKIVDKKEVYTNGTELIPIFRVKQWLDHADVALRAEVAREIFEEIEKHLFVIAPIEEFDGWARIQLADIMRLKKKYAEAEPPKGD